MKNPFKMVGDWWREMSKDVRKGYAEQEAFLAKNKVSHAEAISYGLLEGVVSGLIIGIPVIVGVGLIGDFFKKKSNAQNVPAAPSQSWTATEAQRSEPSADISR